MAPARAGHRQGCGPRGAAAARGRIRSGAAGSDGLRVVGRVSATVVKNCVVTLEPIESAIDEAVDLLFLPEAPAAARRSELQAVEADEPPELRDGVVDLGAVATEFLLLGIDPYPRQPAAVFDAPPAGDPSRPSVRRPGGAEEGDTAKGPLNPSLARTSQATARNRRGSLATGASPSRQAIVDFHPVASRSRIPGVPTAGVQVDPCPIRSASRSTPWGRPRPLGGRSGRRGGAGAPPRQRISSWSATRPRSARCWRPIRNSRLPRGWCIPTSRSKWTTSRARLCATAAGNPRCGLPSTRSRRARPTSRSRPATPAR